MNKFVYAILFLLSMPNQTMAGSSFYGEEGFINTPSAQKIPDRNFNLSLSYLPGNGSFIYTGTSNLLYSVFFGFIPRTEFGIVFNQVFTGKPDRDNPYLRTSFFDRSVNVKVQLIEEDELIPAISIGGRDILSNSVVNPRDGIIVTSHQQIFYAAMAKNIYDFKLNVGYAYAPDLPLGVTSQKANSIVNRSFRVNGFFAAVESPKFFYTSGILEYDSKNFNYALDIGPFYGFSLKAAMVGITNFNTKLSWTAPL